MEGAGTYIRPAFTTWKHARERERVVYALLIPTETFMHACLRPTEAVRFHERKCGNNHQLIVAIVQRFLQQACAAHFCVIQTCKTPYALRIYMQTLISVFFIHGNGHMHACLMRG